MQIHKRSGFGYPTQEQDYATTYKLTRIAPFYSNMQKEQTTADHSCVFLVFLNIILGYKLVAVYSPLCPCSSDCISSLYCIILHLLEQKKI